MKQVFYIAYNSSFGVGIAALVDQNGNPLVDNDFFNISSIHIN